MAQSWAMELYQSKAWHDLRQVLILQRGLRCEECGKLVPLPSMLIGDHVQELTPENVHDPAVALNPDNVRLICADCHNKKHQRFGYNSHTVYLVYGPPCSGKTSLVNQMRQRGDIIIDMDVLYQAISGCSLYDKPDNIKAAVFRARDTLLDVVKTRYGQWLDAYVIGGYPHKAQREALARKLGARLVYCEATKEECLARAAERGVHKGDWKRYIEKWFEDFEP